MTNHRFTIITHRVCECDHGQNEHHDEPLPLDHYKSGRYRIVPDDDSFCEGCVDEQRQPHQGNRGVYHRFVALKADGR